MSTTPSATPKATLSEAQLQQMAAEIHQEIPEAEVRLFGSHARGQGRPDSDVDLMIIVSDQWLAQHDRWAVLDRLRWRLSQPTCSVDLLLYSQSQVEQRRQLRSNVVSQAYEHGVRLHPLLDSFADRRQIPDPPRQRSEDAWTCENSIKSPNW